MSKLANLEPKMGNLARFWEPWRLFLDVGGDLAPIGENKKTTTVQHFGRFCSWKLSWLILALCWAMLGHLGAILEQLGDKMRPKSAKMSQDGAQERQDEAR